ncbi:Cysteine--tRNA ligase, cytoplasmic [Dirofilaria immitis]
MHDSHFLKKLKFYYHSKDMQTSNSSTEFGKIVNEFHLLVRKCIQQYYNSDINEGYQKYDKRELKLMDEFLQIKSEVNATLCSTIDTKLIGKKLK